MKRSFAEYVSDEKSRRSAPGLPRSSLRQASGGAAATGAGNMGAGEWVSGHMGERAHEVNGCAPGDWLWVLPLQVRRSHAPTGHKRRPLLRTPKQSFNHAGHPGTQAHVRPCPRTC